MTLWRGSTTPEVQAEMDQMFEATAALTKGLLGKHGELTPASIFLMDTGEQRVVAVDPEGPEVGTRNVIDLLYEGARSNSALLRCVAVYSDVRIGGAQPTDAIRIHVEHREGSSVVVYIPYTIKRRLLRRYLEVGELQAGPEQRRIW